MGKLTFNTVEIRFADSGGNTGYCGFKDSADGILFLGYQRGYAQIRIAAEEKKEYWATRMNRAVSDLLAELFPEDVTPFAEALLLGNDNALDYASDTALRISGIRQVVAVSGLHVAILYMMLRAVTLNHRFLTALIGIPVLYLYWLRHLRKDRITRLWELPCCLGWATLICGIDYWFISPFLASIMER